MSKVDPNLGQNSGWLFGFPIQDVGWVDRSQTDPLATHDTSSNSISIILHFMSNTEMIILKVLLICHYKLHDIF